MENRDFIDRQALLSHLYDVRALELAKYQLANQINENTNKINHLGYKTPFVKPKFIEKLILSIVISFFVSFAAIFYISAYILDDGMLGLPIEILLLLIPFIGSVLIAAAVGIVVFVQSMNKLNAYNKNKKADEQRVANEMLVRQQLISDNESNIGKMNELNQILSQSYSINIVPSPFRNVDGVCYLYDYLSTSRESLESALLNFNMNKLNINMQQMIEMQCDMLLQQYITNARLGEVKSQNGALLDKLSAIERNTQLAAKYAAMNEANTRTVAFFKTYDFLRQ